MKNRIRNFVKGACVLVTTMCLSQTQSIFAGYTGFVNGAGIGWASVHVRSSALQTNRVTTVNNLLNPSAAMAPTSGYRTNAPLPGGASTNTYARVRGAVGGQLLATVNAVNGDGTDNAELQNRITIIPADCASLTSDSKIDQTQEEFAANGNSGTITVNAKATSGTALWLRGFEFTGSMGDVPADNPDTVENESVEYMKIHGVAKFETLVLGPFEFGGAKCPLIIPFTLTSSNLEHLVIAADGVALSLPLVIICPPDVAVKCDEPVAYPPVQYAGCGEMTVSYNPPAPAGGTFPAGAFPVGITPVTVTATDSAGNSTNCTFNVIVTDTTAPVVPALPTLTGQCSVTVPQPAPVTDNCGGLVNGTTSDPLIYTNQGTFTVRWTFSDGNGNTNTANQTVIVRDTLPPMVPVLPVVTGGCSSPVTLPVPTTTDNCSGTITVTPNVPQVLTAIGTNRVQWTFTDAAGNSSTTYQTGIVAGLTFTGFFAPINGVGGTCATPLVTKAPSSSLPIKFDIHCGTTPITGGTPPIVRIQAYGANCVAGAEIVVTNAVYQNDWHYNWNVANRIGGIYKITIQLPDGTSQYVFVKLK